ncbi:MAG: hypothetical protein NT154_06720 [Verrucomicrobia bacterium]|nr:hypothetical protein [Verrucomicrobiota bacterium]
MSNWFADAVGSAAGGLVYAFGGGAAEQARGDALDAQLQRMNTTDYSPGGQIYGQIQDNRGTAAADQALVDVQSNLQTGATPNVLGELTQAGREGANAGLAGFWNQIGGALRGLLGIFPWWLWLMAGGVLFIYLGGLGWLERQARSNLQ